MQRGRPVKGSGANRPKARNKAGTTAAPSIADLQEQVGSLSRELKEALERQKATAEVLQVINRSPGNLVPVFDTILEKAHSLCGVTQGSLQLYDGSMFRAVAVRGLSGSFVDRLREGVRLNPNAPGPHLLKGARFVHIHDLGEADDPMSRAAFELAGIRTLLFIPLRKNGVLLGRISASRPEVKPFTPKEITILEDFAAQAVIAMENARLFNETREALEQQTATAEVLQVINSSPGDLAPVFDMILEKAHSLCEVSHGSLQLYDGEKFRAVAAHGIAEAFADRLRQGFVPGPNHPSQQLLQGARFAQVPDCAEINDPIFRAAFELGGIRTVLFIPLCKEGSLIGQIAAARRDVSPFTENEITLLENFAAQVVIAIENARLFNEVQAKTRDLEESLQQQTATADVLKVISRSAFDLQIVLDTLTESAARLCGADSAAIARQNADGGYYHATRFNFSADWEHVSHSVRLGPERGSLVGRVLLARSAVQITDVLADPEYAYPEQQKAGNYRTLLGVPLLRSGVPIGVLFLCRTTVAPFSDKQIELVQTFADQAVIAIENVRLFEEVQAKTRDLEEALRYQTGSANILNVIASSPTDVGPVLKAIVESACELCGAYDALVRLKSGDNLEFSAHHGPIPVTSKDLPINRDSTSGVAVIERRPVHVHDLLTEEGDGFPEAQERARRFGHRTILSMPLVREGESIGAIILRRTEVNPFSDKQIALLQTFADQAVIAIGNARLFEEVQARTRELARSLEDLRTAQDRLIQTEKLASLGQLTAGIAHEIKNPLNFVNNFSSLSVELTGELNEVLKQERLTDKGREEVDELTGLLKDNLGKVVEHGKRADSIVKNMLLHSREGSGERRAAHINALVGESLNLAYHGARAEKPSFTITLKHDLDPKAGTLELYPQEITRALLNLISNGFYAATKRKAESNDDKFEPVLSATTRNLGETVEIRIRDNGTGIPPEVREKIFNPFFTTKPTGEGTGLGLSMTHDIVVKQHGGRIDVVTELGAFTEFIIILPRDKGTAAGSKSE